MCYPTSKEASKKADKGKSFEKQKLLFSVIDKPVNELELNEARLLVSHYRRQEKQFDAKLQKAYDILTDIMP